jgi:hypothetical protein
MVMVKVTILAMTIILFSSSNGHGQTGVSTLLTNFNNKKSGIAEMVMIKVGLTIITMKIL